MLRREKPKAGCILCPTLEGPLADLRHRLFEYLQYRGWPSRITPKSGHLYMLCPFHQERTPSLQIWATLKWHCYGCQANGVDLQRIFDYFGQFDMDWPTRREWELAGQLSLKFNAEAELEWMEAFLRVYYVDARLNALATGLDQLTTVELNTILNTNPEHMIFDGGNYDIETKRYCPLAVALGIPEKIGDRDTTNAEVEAFIETVGKERSPDFIFNQMHGTPGYGYREDRPGDLKRVVQNLLHWRTTS